MNVRQDIVLDNLLKLGDRQMQNLRQYTTFSFSTRYLRFSTFAWWRVIILFFHTKLLQWFFLHFMYFFTKFFLTISPKLVCDKGIISFEHLFTKPSSFVGFQLVIKIMLNSNLVILWRKSYNIMKVGTVVNAIFYN